MRGRAPGLGRRGGAGGAGRRGGGGAGGPVGRGDPDVPGHPAAGRRARRRAPAPRARRSSTSRAISPPRPRPGSRSTRSRPRWGRGGQWLPLDPPAPGTATLGGVLAANAAGPRRQGYGTARDLVIGMRVVAADGQLIRAGGKVVKNVAGYDLVKLYIGSLGTLGIIVDATLKLRPRPEAEGACWATFASLDAAAGAAGILAGSELGPVVLTLLDARAAEACGPVAGLPAAAAPAVLVAFDGLARAVAWEGEEAARRLRAAGARAVDDARRRRDGARARGGARDAAPSREPGGDRHRGRAPGGGGTISRGGPDDRPGGRVRARRGGARGPRAGDARPRPRRRAPPGRRHGRRTGRLA